MAWHRISPEVTDKVFKMCCMFNAVDETDDGMSSNVGEENGNVRSEHEEDEGSDCEGGDNDTDC
jgi:hypothetical protein